jgi:hypothetical protein
LILMNSLYRFQILFLLQRVSLAQDITNPVYPRILELYYSSRSVGCNISFAN